MGSYRVDTSRWPIVIQTHEGELSDAEFDAFMQQATDVLRGKKGYVVILDARAVGKVTPHMRARSVAWQREHYQMLKENCLGSVSVLSSPLMRFISMTVKLVTRLPTPYTTTATLEEAIAWAEQRLAEAR